jgi:PAS domain S-box-containing protein
MNRRGLDFVELVSNGQVLQHILFACPDGVIVVNADDEVVLFSGASEHLFGFAPVDVMHRLLARLFEDKRAYVAFRRDMCAEGAIVSRELAAVRSGGSTFVAAISGAPLHDRDGTVLGAIFYVRDRGRMCQERGAA